MNAQTLTFFKDHVNVNTEFEIVFAKGFDMPLNIRDPRAGALARTLANKRGTTMTEAIIAALQAEIARDDAKPPLADAVKAISNDLLKQSQSPRNKMSKADIDFMWGQ